MITQEISSRELKRLKALDEYRILDTPNEAEYDDIAQLAAYISDAPVALVSFIDINRQWFKSKVGVEMCETERNISFCTHAIEAEEDVLEIKNALEDDRFKNNPLTQSPDQPVIYYCGFKLTDSRGMTLGTLCIIDHKPRTISDNQKKSLRALSKQIVKLLELRRNFDLLKRAEKSLKEKNSLLQDFAGTVSHDIKMPLANMVLTVDILKKKYETTLDKEGVNYLNYLKKSSFSLSEYITSILNLYESEVKDHEKSKESFDLKQLLEEIIDLFNIKHECEIKLPHKNLELHCNRAALEQILLNLIGNSLKYNDKEKIVIKIKCKEKEGFYHFSVNDNGVGIPKEKQKEIFNLFSTAAITDRNGNKGNGIGLSTVKKLVKKLGGKIKVKSELGEFTKVSFTIKK